MQKGNNSLSIFRYALVKKREKLSSYSFSNKYAHFVKQVHRKRN